MSSSVSSRSRAPAEGSSQPPNQARENGGERPLKQQERIELALLALPTFALALAITIVSTQLSEVARAYTRQTTVIGTIIAGAL